jgi:hypothetical protein
MISLLNEAADWLVKLLTKTGLLKKSSITTLFSRFDGDPIYVNPSIT